MDVLHALLVLLTVLTYETQTQRVKMCYLENSSMEKTKFNLTAFNATQCTHIIYAFSTISDDGQDLQTTNEKDKDNYAQLKSFKEKNPSLKLLLSVKGNYSKITSDTVRTFAAKALNFLEVNNFDGFDLFADIVNKQVWQALKDSAMSLVGIFAKNAETTKKKPILTLPVWGKPKLLASIKHKTSIIKYVDYFLLMTYKMWGRWYNKLAHHAPLDIRPDDAKKDRHLSKNSIKEVVKAWLDHGVPPSKLVMGLAFFGVTATLKSPEQHQIGDPYALRTGKAGNVSQEKGILYYSEICSMSPKWEEVEVPINEGAIAFNLTEWVSYDNANTIKNKTEYALRTSLAGVFIWTVDKDRHDTACGNVSFPLMNSVEKAFEENRKKCDEFKFECPKEWKDGEHHNQHPDPKNCSSFYQCNSPGTAGSVFHSMPCPDGLHYDQKNHVCNYPHLAGCLTCQ